MGGGGGGVVRGSKSWPLLFQTKMSKLVFKPGVRFSTIIPMSLNDNKSLFNIFKIKIIEKPEDHEVDPMFTSPMYSCVLISAHNCTGPFLSVGGTIGPRLSRTHR